MIENCQITKVSLSMADHGCLTFDVFVEGAGWGCAIGGYCIGHGYLDASKFSADNGSGLVAMMRIMDTVGVSKWEDLKGKYCRVEYEGMGDTIHKIGNLIEDKWFDLKEFFVNYGKENQNTQKGL